MSCSWSIDVERYYDGELTPTAAARVEQHLRECPECRAFHAELGRLSELLAAAPLAAIGPAAVRRLQEARRTAARDWGIRRAAGFLTAAAAAVLVGALLTWPAESNNAGEVALWQTAAVMPPGEGGPLLLAAQWMADDLSVGQMR